jgi:uncharacterized protein
MWQLYVSFIAVFERPHLKDEMDWEKLLWKQLQMLHDVDQETWDPTVSSDPESPNFSYSFAGQAYFVAGLFSGSSRLACRFGWTAIVFNAHWQFEELRKRGIFDRIKAEIHRRETVLQGEPNPSSADFGEAPENRQCSGREVEKDWKCPFRPKTQSRCPFARAFRPFWSRVFKLRQILSRSSK